jgi:hypothetical protein
LGSLEIWGIVPFLFDFKISATTFAASSLLYYAVSHLLYLPKVNKVLFFAVLTFMLQFIVHILEFLINYIMKDKENKTIHTVLLFLEWDDNEKKFKIPSIISFAPFSGVVFCAGFGLILRLLTLYNKNDGCVTRTNMTLDEKLHCRRERWKFERNVWIDATCFTLYIILWKYHNLVKEHYELTKTNYVRPDARKASLKMVLMIMTAALVLLSTLSTSGVLETKNAIMIFIVLAAGVAIWYLVSTRNEGSRVAKKRWDTLKMMVQLNGKSTSNKVNDALSGK